MKRRLVVTMLFTVVALASHGGLTHGAVMINEIHYDPDVKTEAVEFIELYNAGGEIVNLSGWRFDKGVDYEFPSGTLLAAGGYVVIAQDPAAILSKFSVSALGPFSGSLSNDGERLTLRNAAWEIMDEVDYGAGFPWPSAAHGQGQSMELIHPSLDNDLGGNWRPSGGYTGGAAPTLLIAEQSDWRYRKGTSEPSTPLSAWRQPGFVEDGSWLTGQASIGYGEGHIRTSLADMRGLYSTVYFRKTFNVNDSAAVSSLLLQAQFDDAVNVWINGTHVLSYGVTQSELPYTATGTNRSGEQAYEDIALPAPSGYLVTGANTIAVQLLNTSLGGSSDATWDCRLLAGAAIASSAPSPGARNTVYATVAPPLMRQVRHAPQQPRGGESVTVSVKVTDPDGVASVTLHYQLVNPGSYITIDDANFWTDWTDLAMRDDGLNGDAVSGDDVYSVVMPGALQTHRRLVRYRITARDATALALTAPYSDDPQPNFAYFCYDGVPAWSGAIEPGSGNPARSLPTTYDPGVLESLPTYHLLSREADVLNCQYNGTYNDGVYRWHGALVYDGIVYDHIRYRIKGAASTYRVGKNKWKFNFNSTHHFQARDNYGRKYSTKWDKLVFSTGTCPWWQYPHPGGSWDRGTEGMVMNEALSMRLYQLAGVPASNTHFVHFRVIDRAAEDNPSNQYEGDFWGLYIAVEQVDGHFLDEHELPDGNFYKMAGGGSHLTNQGPTQVSDKSDLNTFKSNSTGYNRTGPIQPLSWWEANCDLQEYYSYKSVSVGVNNSDRRPDWNCMYHHNPLTGRWAMFPWDLDLTYEYGPHYTDMEHWRYVLGHSEAAIDYANRARELLDLLFNPDEGARLVDELAAFISKPGAPTFVQASRAQWDYHPRVASRGRAGSFYKRNEYLDYLTQNNFDGIVTYMQHYISGKNWPAGVWQPSANVYGGLKLAQDAADASIPYKPTISHIGAAGFPINDLRFQCGSFSDPQGAGTFKALKWRIGEISDPTAINFDPSKAQKYEVKALWESAEIAPFVDTIRIPQENLRVGGTYRVRVRMQDATHRWSHWSAPVEFVSSEPSNAVFLRDYLRITELMYDPPAGSDFEYIELYNTDASTTLDLSGVSFTSGIDFTIPQGTTLAPGGYLLVTRADPAGDFAAFRAHYGLDASVAIAGPYTGKLKNSGEELRLKTARSGTELLAFEYDNARGWPIPPQSGGHSLVPLDGSLAADSAAPLYYGGNWRASTFMGGSPGAADPTPPTGVALNEIAAHTDTGQLPPNDSNDWIEIHNPTTASITLNDYYLSDDVTDPTKWAIPNGTIIGVGAFLVFDEITDFHNPTGFGLNKAGEQVILSQLPATGAQRIVDSVRFKGQENGMTLGRYPDGDAYWFAMPPTRSAANAAPNPDAVFSEIMYHAADGTTLSEYLEISNPTDQMIPLWNSTGEWRLAGGVSYTFPPSTTLQPKGILLVVHFDPTDATALAAFKATYGLTAIGSPVVGPFNSDLSNRVDRVALERPQAPDQVGDSVSWVIVDETYYFDQLPFPVTADGGGSSLQRGDDAHSGNEPANWLADTPSPGSLDTILSPPTLNLLPAGNIDIDSATLNGDLLQTGGEAPIVRFYWGTTDGAKVGKDWENFQELGVHDAGPYTLSLSNLTDSTRYYFQTYALNSAGHQWGAISGEFTTDAPSTSHTKGIWLLY